MHTHRHLLELLGHLNEATKEKQCLLVFFEQQKGDKIGASYKTFYLSIFGNKAQFITNIVHTLDLDIKEVQLLAC